MPPVSAKQCPSPAARVVTMTPGPNWSSTAGTFPECGPHSRHLSSRSDSPDSVVYLVLQLVSTAGGWGFNPRIFAVSLCCLFSSLTCCSVGEKPHWNTFPLSARKKDTCYCKRSRSGKMEFDDFNSRLKIITPKNVCSGVF